MKFSWGLCEESSFLWVQQSADNTVLWLAHTRVALLFAEHSAITDVPSFAEWETHSLWNSRVMEDFSLTKLQQQFQPEFKWRQQSYDSQSVTMSIQSLSAVLSDNCACTSRQIWCGQKRDCHGQGDLKNPLIQKWQYLWYVFIRLFKCSVESSSTVNPGRNTYWKAAWAEFKESLYGNK